MLEKTFFSIIPLTLIFSSLFLYLKNYYLKIGFRVRANHIVQPLCAAVIYLYWGQGFPEAYNHLIHLIPQFLFAYLLKFNLAYIRKKEFVFDFGPIPIVFSLNFFMWFPNEKFYLYYLLIALALVTKEFICWKKKAEPNHVFNPSAIALVTFIIFLILTNSHSLTLSQLVANSLNQAPYMYEVLFFLGIFINFFIPMLWVTFGAVFIMSCLHFIPLLFFNYTDPGTPFDVSIFLGMTLLITDPSTTPKSPLSRFLFGVAYGLSVQFAGLMLSYIGSPTHYDKLLFAPLLNLAVPWFDKVGMDLKTKFSWTHLNLNKIHTVVLYSILFFLILPVLKG